jgi:hypothetical protein
VGLSLANQPPLWYEYNTPGHADLLQQEVNGKNSGKIITAQNDIFNPNEFILL